MNAAVCPNCRQPAAVRVTPSDWVGGVGYISEDGHVHSQDQWEWDWRCMNCREAGKYLGKYPCPVCYTDWVCPGHTGALTGADAAAVEHELLHGTPDTPARIETIRQADEIYARVKRAKSLRAITTTTTTNLTADLLQIQAWFAELGYTVALADLALAYRQWSWAVFCDWWVDLERFGVADLADAPLTRAEILDGLLEYLE